MGKKFLLLCGLFLGLASAAMAEDSGVSKAEAPKAKSGHLLLAEGEVASDKTSESRSNSGLPIPRFVSLRSGKVFIRTGPALRYPIKWVYQKEHLPVEIVQEFDTWRKIRDRDGDEGWIHQSLLSGDRYVIVKAEENVAVRKNPEDKARLTAWLEPNVMAALKQCTPAWCEVDTEGYDGWTLRKNLWGIYDHELFD